MNHLELLRTEHVRLQSQHADLQRRYDVLEANQVLNCAQSGEDVLYLHNENDGFVKRLVETIIQLYNNELYSDIVIKVNDHSIKAHKLVLVARTNFWGNLATDDNIQLTDLSFEDAQVLIKWFYTDAINNELSDSCIISLLNASMRYSLENLKLRCERILIGRLEVNNCLKIYQFAETNKLDKLLSACIEFVSLRWKDFEPHHFENMAAPLLYEMLKRCFRRKQHLLNSIITLKREDVVFLYLIENDSTLQIKLNEEDNQGKFPLDLALETQQINIANSLITHGANINQLDSKGLSFLWKAIENENVLACNFLSSNKADLLYVNKLTGDSILHLLAQKKCLNKLLEWVKEYISEFDLNLINLKNRTPLMIAIENENMEIFNLIILQSKLDVNVKNADEKTALEIALLDKKNLEMASQLVKNENIDLNYVDSKKGYTLFHKAVLYDDIAAIQFLVNCNVIVNKTTVDGTTALHIFFSHLPSHGAIATSKLDILKILLKAGVDPSIKEITTGLTPLHLAVERDNNVLKILLKFYPKEIPLFVLDNENRSPLWCALLAGKFDSAKTLIDAGADVNEKSGDGKQLLIRAIELKRDDITRFLLDNKAIAAVTSSNGYTCLNLAVEQGLTSTVDYLCKLGANLNFLNPKTGLSPLWTALEKNDYGTAEVLVGHGCDIENSALNEDSLLEETLLHRFIDKFNQKAAIFLIKSGCNVNALKKLPASVSSNGKKIEDIFSKNEINVALKQTPLHVSVQWGLTDVTKALISNLNCKIDAQDFDGRTAAHIAVIEQDQVTLELLLSHPDPSSVLNIRDRYGQTPLSTAIKNKNTKAAEAICKRLPHTAVQTNGNGENLLHYAVKSNDLESVLFLLSLQVNVNIYTQNQEKMTALHLCAEIGNELIFRNLLLAGADVNAKNAHLQTPLHLAASKDNASICKILLENNANPNIVDVDGNNALHVAVGNGAINATQTLLIESDIDYLAVNKKRQNIMHLCAINVGIISAEVFLTILEIHPKFSLEIPDMYGNTLFLLSFLNGNSELCRLALRNGACMGAVNNQGQSVFNIDTPTKQLLFGLLDGLEREPRWAEGEQCSECETKFSLTMRKHHCRHCGRLICAKCSEHQMPILKYEISKNVRVCQICYDVLTMGDGNSYAE